jgi:hypothetical protein
LRIVELIGANMSDTFWIVGEIIVGIALLTVLGSAIAVALPRLIPETGGNATDILDRRYARGELTREQYLHMREDVIGPTMPQASPHNGHAIGTPPAARQSTPR